MTAAKIAEGEQMARERKLATDLDRERLYLSGLLLRFDEEMSEAVSFFSKGGFKFQVQRVNDDAAA